MRKCVDEWMPGWGMRTYWSAIFSVAGRVRRALFAWWRVVLRSHTKAGFTLKNPAGRERGPTSEYLSQLSDALAAFQRMSDRRRLGIKNEMDEKNCLVLSVKLRSFRKHAGML
jgi:hypothetical protein